MFSVYQCRNPSQRKTTTTDINDACDLATCDTDTVLDFDKPETTADYKCETIRETSQDVATKYSFASEPENVSLLATSVPTLNTHNAHHTEAQTALSSDKPVEANIGKHLSKKINDFSIMNTIQSGLLDNSDDSNIDKNRGRSSSDLDVCLSSFCSSLPSDVEAHLKDLLMQRLAKGTLLSISGSTAMLDMSKGETSSTSSNEPTYYGVYTHLLHSYSTVSTGLGDDKIFLICLLDEDIQKFHQFDHELSYFFENTMKEKLRLTCDDTEETKELFVMQFSKWHERLINYLPRTIKFLRNVLPLLLTYICYCAKISVACDDVSRREDINQFLDACLVFEALLPDLPSSGNISVTLSVQGRQVLFISNDESELLPATEFCKEWSLSLLNTIDQENPIVTKQAVQDYQLRASHDLNLSKRAVCEAVSDYYALYKFSLVLKRTGNASALLHHLMRLCANIPGELEVLNVVSEFLKSVQAIRINSVAT